MNLANAYQSIGVQFSRECPFNCEFCDIIEIYGRRPRTKAVSQVLAELDQLRAAGWREAVFIVDDNFIGNKARAKELCVALAEWRNQHKVNFDFNTEATERQDLLFSSREESTEKIRATSSVTLSITGFRIASSGTEVRWRFACCCCQ